MFDGREYSSSSSSSAAVADECFSDLVNTLSKKKRSRNKRRFSDAQIRSMETIFQSETKLDPRKKLQLATELGLQPRQVAIWFQNKRARWKSNQLQRDFCILQANYDTLASQFDNLKKEKQSLVTQLQKLNELIEKSQKEGRSCRQEVPGNSIGGVSDKVGVMKSQFDIVKPKVFLERSEHDVGVVLSDDDSSIKADYLEEREPEVVLQMVEQADGSLTSPEEWGGLDFESAGLLHHPTSSYQWWDFWS